MYIYVHIYLNIHQHFHMLKKLYTLKEEFEILNLNIGPELKSVNFPNSVPTIVFLGCFSLCICRCGREHKTQPIHLTCYFKYQAYQGMGLMEFLKGIASTDSVLSHEAAAVCTKALHRGASLCLPRLSSSSWVQNHEDVSIDLNL